jgi:hypothetical protein
LGMEQYGNYATDCDERVEIESEWDS